MLLQRFGGGGPPPCSLRCFLPRSKIAAQADLGRRAADGLVFCIRSVGRAGGLVRTFGGFRLRGRFGDDLAPLHVGATGRASCTASPRQRLAWRTERQRTIAVAIGTPAQQGEEPLRANHQPANVERRGASPASSTNGHPAERHEGREKAAAIKAKESRPDRAATGPRPCTSGSVSQAEHGRGRDAGHDQVFGCAVALARQGTRWRRWAAPPRPPSP